MGHNSIIIGLLTLFLSLDGIASPWVTAYYGGWWTHRKDSALKPDQIDYSALTHIIYFGIIPNENGTLDLAHYFVESTEAKRLTQLAHRAKKKALIGVTKPLDIRALQVENLTDNLVNVVRTFDYDGIDIDWEPLKIGDSNQYAELIHSLRTKLDELSKVTHKPHYLITVAVIDLPALFAKLQNEIDQINLMTYDLSGLWLEETWHNTPLYSPAGSGLPSVDEVVKEFKTAGVSAKKLGVGIDFYGYQWASHSEKIFKPRQRWNIPPEVDPSVSYTDIVTKFIPISHKKWDWLAHVPYLSRTSNTGESSFLSYDNPASCRAKTRYVLLNELGGTMAWELGGQWIPSNPVKDPLLQSMRVYSEKGNSTKGRE